MSLRRAFSLAYKLALTLAAGALVASLASATFHYKAVHSGIETAERLIGQGRLAEADALAYTLAFDPASSWARCFPGHFRTFGCLRVRCLIRTGQFEAAKEVAEALHLDADEPVLPNPLNTLAANPLAWLQKFGVSMVASYFNGFFPIERPTEWSGYETLLAELITLRDAPTLEILASDLAQRFPRSPVAIYANSAKAEVDPIRFPTSSQDNPDATKTAPAPGAESAAPETNTPEPAPATTDVEAASQPEAPPPPVQPASWGIVTNARSLAINPQTGQPIRQLKAGDVLVIEGTCSFHNVSALTGTLILNNRNVPDLAFRGEDLEIHQGPFDSVPPAEVALRSRLAQINIEEAALGGPIPEETGPVTTEEKAYRQCMDRMAAFQKDSQSLQAKLEKATGNERMAILDKLRLMKYQEQAILRDLQTKKEAMDAVARSSGKPRADPRLMALHKEKQAILKRLAAPAP